MTATNIVRQTAAHVKHLLSGDSSGHDWWHVYRVWQNALTLGQAEGADLFIVELAALLHDIADWKFHDGDTSAGPRAARAWLQSLELDQPTITQVCDIIGRLSFKGAGVDCPLPTLEGQVVQDADRLDALGAIGIARAFAYGGHAGRALYDPDMPPQLHDSFEAYRSSKGPTINHFYEKLLLLRDRMNTSAGRQMAAQRHQFMEEFLEQFYREWAGLIVPQIEADRGQEN